MTTSLIFGYWDDPVTHEHITSYEVQPNSPGASLLTSYELTQVQCGPQGLVVIYGPENSVICANPNHLVQAGEYELNSETLSLTSIAAPAAQPAAQPPAPAPQPSPTT
jgi:hypothetical protein